jgi:Caspase domain
MAPRAIVISIANYSNDTTLGKTLPGAAESAKGFLDWLVQSKLVASTDIVELANPTRIEFEKAFRDLVDKGRDTTERLFIFYSGHGFSFQNVPGKKRPADVLVTAEFENLQDSGHSCLKLDDLQDKLFNCLGGGEHFYFIDACRNLADASDVNPTEIGWVRPASTSTPTIFTMFSVERLNPAVDNKQFAAQLVEGLSGKGKAKKYEGPRLVVTFNSLCDYLKDVRAREIDFARSAGNGSGEIFEVKPIQNHKCAVEVINATPADQFTLTIQNARQQPIGAPQPFVGQRTEFQQPPDDYYLGVMHPTDAVQPVGDNHADLYEDTSVKFQKVAGAPAAPQPVVAPGTVSLSSVPNTTLVIENLQTGATVSSPTAFEGPLAPGEYFVRMKTPGGRTLRRKRLSVAAGGHEILDVAARASSPVRDGLVAAIPGAHDRAQIDFSESLGPMADDDLGLWLSIIGASRIIGFPGQFNKLKDLELPSFEDVLPGGSAVFLLLGLEEAPLGVDVSVTASARNPDWQTFTTQRTPNMPGVFAWHVGTEAGQRFISVRLTGKAPLTFASYALPNRATLFILTQDESGEIGVHQYLLPIRHLVPNLQPEERRFFDAPPLQTIRFMALAQKQLAEARRLTRGTTDPAVYDQWFDLLNGKWLDPVMAIMACYELQRSGEALGSVVMNNLTQYFGQLPDVAAISARLGAPTKPPDAVPMFLAGVRAFPELELPLPKGKLDFSSPWTSWVGAVR